LKGVTGEDYMNREGNSLPMPAASEPGSMLSMIE
jgi:hypothetical protein